MHALLLRLRRCGSMKALKPEQYLVTDKVPLIEHSTRPSIEAQEMKLLIQKRRRLLIFCICGLILVFLCMLGLYAVNISPEFNQYRLVRAYAEITPTTEQSTRTILLWNSFFGNKRWSLPDDTLGPAYFRDDLSCAVYKCELTNEKDFLPAVDMYDAIVFHTAQHFSVMNSVPAKRAAKQFYVFALMEPPGETKHILNDEGYFYNLTMTYRLDSDIIWPYQYIISKETGAVVAPIRGTPLWLEPPVVYNDTAVWNSWHTKNKTAAWFVSHCKTLSQREQLAAALQDYIDVDIFGKCGTMSCPYTATECDDMLDREYKFYFSFENALCKDYVTEKLYNALKRQIIPVVFGAANYTNLLPPHSYINVEDFENVQQLGNYLKYLATHPAEYMRYFWWRQHYELGYHSPFCDLCEQLHSATNQQKSQTYRNIEQWWLGDSCRLDSKIKF